VFSLQTPFYFRISNRHARKKTLDISTCAHNIQDNLSCLTEKFSRVLISRFSDMQNKSIVLAIFPVEP
jgi:hypothetical protein